MGGGAHRIVPAAAAVAVIAGPPAMTSGAPVPARRRGEA